MTLVGLPQIYLISNSQSVKNTNSASLISLQLILLKICMVSCSQIPAVKGARCRRCVSFEAAIISCYCDRFASFAALRRGAS